MAIYRPPQRSIPARILVGGAWISGRFHLAEVRCFADALADPTATFLKLTDVTIGGGRQTPFLALRRSAASVIVPLSEEPRVVTRLQPPNLVPQSIECLLDGTSIRGSVHLLPSTRVSDFLRYQQGFFAMRGCTFGGGPLALAGNVPLLFVGATAVVGLCDEAASPGDMADEIEERPSEVKSPGRGLVAAHATAVTSAPVRKPAPAAAPRSQEAPTRTPAPTSAPPVLQRVRPK
jgi:hypothetical protein